MLRKFSYFSIPDLKSSFVVALIALPLCLGISLASGAPLYAGLISGLVGGLVVGFLGGSELSVSGPSAALSVILVVGVRELGGFPAVCMAIAVAGLFQIALGFLRAGKISHFFPASVVEGMLVSIGLIILFKQIPHLLGYDMDFIGDDSFIQNDGYNTFSEISVAWSRINPGSVLISALAFGVMFLWDSYLKRRFQVLNVVPAAAVAVLVSVITPFLLFPLFHFVNLSAEHFVQIPTSGLFSVLSLDFSPITRAAFWKLVAALTVSASMETLLSMEATDKLDPKNRFSDKNRELKAQGIGNIISALLGGLPLTSAVIRSSANITQGAQTRASAILHGFWILVAVLLIPSWINLIPLACLSAILVLVGYKLSAPRIFKAMWKRGLDTFIPFIVTILAVLFTGLLMGILIGWIAGILCVTRRNFHSCLVLIESSPNYLLRFNRDVSFLNKSQLRDVLLKIPQDSAVTIDGSRSVHIDEDIVDMIREYENQARFRNIKVQIQRSSLALHSYFKE